ncbi:MAG: hypothetical protein KC613_18835 [Myxococcales bacterium]|nr:hypothetical protein [Myxococcales bacterium]MCB9522850.1 hypothetical protein [Myxococcales bacterium]
MAAPDLTDLPSALERLAALEVELQRLQARVAELEGAAPAPQKRDDSVFGWATDLVESVSEDFDEPLDEFAEYQ